MFTRQSIKDDPILTLHSYYTYLPFCHVLMIVSYTVSYRVLHVYMYMYVHCMYVQSLQPAAKIIRIILPILPYFLMYVHKIIGPCPLCLMLIKFSAYRARQSSVFFSFSSFKMRINTDESVLVGGSGMYVRMYVCKYAGTDSSMIEERCLACQPSLAGQTLSVSGSGQRDYASRRLIVVKICVSLLAHLRH